MTEYVLFLTGLIGVINLALIVGYQYVLFFVYLLAKRVHVPEPSTLRKFVVVIPAHNEELLIEETLRSIYRIDYPRDRLMAVVIADNCTDETAKVVRSMGFECLEREDSERRGKSYALDWAFRRIGTDGKDAVVVIDADSKVSKNILTVFNSYLNEGFKVVQSANLVDKNQTGVYPTFFALGNLIANYYVYYPKFRIGSSGFLLGTGMCFHADILERYFCKEYSISEDIEFSLRLIKAGIRIAFTTEAYVETVYPVNIRASSTQRIRWGSGTFALLRNYFAFFLVSGITRRQPIFVDTALTLLSWSKPIIFLIFGVTLGLTLRLSWWMHILTWALFVAEVLYLCIGVILLRRKGYDYRGLWKAPILFPWFLFITILGILGFRRGQWRRTDRG